MKPRRVVITGLGALTPIGNTLPDYWEGLLSGVSGAAPITHFDASKFKTKFACELKGFDPLNFMDRKEVRKCDRFAQYALVATDEAIQDAGLDFDKEDKDRIGVIWGAGIGGLETFQNEVLNFASGDGSPRFNPFFIPKMISDIAPGLISMKHGLRGPNFATVSACASSSNAMIDSLNYIRMGFADIIVPGGLKQQLPLQVLADLMPCMPCPLETMIPKRHHDLLIKIEMVLYWEKVLVHSYLRNTGMQYPEERKYMQNWLEEGSQQMLTI